MNQIKIQMFGAFRKYAPSGSFLMSVPSNMSLGQFRIQFLQDLKVFSGHPVDDNLIFESAFASDELILTDEDLISEYQTLAVLPPVCGG